MKVFWSIVVLIYSVGWILDLVWEIWTAPELPPGTQDSNSPL